MIDWCVEEKEGRKGGVIELKRRVSITGTPNHHHTRSILCRKTGNGVCALARISIFFLIASPQRLFVCCGRSLEAGFSPCVPCQGHVFSWAASGVCGYCPVCG